MPDANSQKSIFFCTPYEPEGKHESESVFGIGGNSVFACFYRKTVFTSTNSNCLIFTSNADIEERQRKRARKQGKHVFKINGKYENFILSPNRRSEMRCSFFWLTSAFQPVDQSEGALLKYDVFTDARLSLDCLNKRFQRRINNTKESPKIKTKNCYKHNVMGRNISKVVIEY